LPRLRRAAGAISVPALTTLERRVLRGAVRLYATSPASRAEIAHAARISEQAVGIIPIPVDLEEFSPATDDEWREAAARPVIVFVGRADDPRKNVLLLFEAFVTLRRRFPRAVLRLVGRPPVGRVPQGVEVVGEVRDVSAELRRGSVFVLPSRQEGFGIVAAEAMAAGLPVVTTPSRGPEDLVRASGAGLVARDHSAHALAQAVESVVAEPARMAEMRRNGRAHVAIEHSPLAFRRRLKAAFNDVESI
jgi:glycosyltransferase involved in cell wall biosynthesis